MDTIIYVAAVLIAITSTVLAFVAWPTFVNIHERWSKAVIYLVLAGFIWLAAGDATALNAIYRIIKEGRGQAPDATLSTVRALAETAHEQHLHVPALFALVFAVVYTQALAVVRARKSAGNAA